MTMQIKPSSLRRSVGLSLLISAISACGDRPDYWDKPLDTTSAQQAVGLTGSAAVLDPQLNRVLMLTAPNELSVDVQALPVGKGVIKAVASQDRQTLFVLSRGVQPRRRANDERPTLHIFDGGIAPKLKRAYELTDPRDELALDAANEWAVAYAGAGVVVNPNELILVDLRVAGSGAAGITSVTLPAYGGRPQRFTFTSELSVPGAAARRFLIVERESDVTLVDLSQPANVQSTVTVPLPQTATGASGVPAAVVYHDRLPTDDLHGGRIAIQMKNDSSVLLLELARDTDGKNDFDLHTNLVDVGGTPAAIDFVQIGSSEAQSLRLAALVGTNAVLVEPDTTTQTQVALPQAFSGITRITRFLNGTPSGGDVALLWGKSTKIAFWALGSVEGTPYRSIDAYDISITVSAVLDVPGEENGRRKILQSSGKDFYVLDLNTRQSAPMQTLQGLSLYVAPDGGRVWAYQSGQTGFARLTLNDLHPVSLSAERSVTQVFDIAAANGQRAALALHTGYASGLGVTVLDANNPDTATARFYSGLAFGGLR